MMQYLKNLLLLLILGGVLAFLRNWKKGPSQIKQSVPERRPTEEQGNDQIDLIYKIERKKFVEII